MRSRLKNKTNIEVSVLPLTAAMPAGVLGGRGEASPHSRLLTPPCQPAGLPSSGIDKEESGSLSVYFEPSVTGSMRGGGPGTLGWGGRFLGESCMNPEGFGQKTSSSHLVPGKPQCPPQPFGCHHGYRVTWAASARASAKCVPRAEDPDAECPQRAVPSLVFNERSR